VAEVRIAALDELTSGEARRFDVSGRRLAVVRVEDAVYIIGDRCSHADASLSEGDVDVQAGTIECPKHGALFALATGEPETLPATKPVPSYVVRVADGDVYVELS
jgi:3-phenylpropionate/trans-cinnamate dioxygenase ferredoxin subunit